MPSIIDRHRGRVLTGSALAVAGALVIVGAVAYLGSETDAGVGDPRDRLQCLNDQLDVTTVTHDNTTIETAKPEMLADRWAAATEPERLQTGRTLDTSTRQVIQRSTNLVDVAFADMSGRTVAILTVKEDARLGWRIQSIVQCWDGESDK